MEQINDNIQMLDLIAQAAFCVKDGIIIRVNEAARKRTVTEGMTVSTILATGAQEYDQFTGGCLYLTLTLGDVPCGASVTRMNDWDVFLLEQNDDMAQLQAMALAAQELRGPLTSVMTVADRLFPLPHTENGPDTQEQVARINRGLFQMQRIICNMSDAYRYCLDVHAQMETQNICALLDEIFRKAEHLISHAGMTLRYCGPNDPILCLVDAEKLERAVHNILSNAVKFAPKGSTIEAKLTRKDNMLSLTVQDGSDGIDRNIRGNIYTRFLREPGLEDSRFGLGLGMVLIRSAATVHGGTVLMEQTAEHGNRLTMTIAIRQNSQSMVRTPVFRVDYASERDHSLLELSDCLPASLYNK